MNDAEHTLKLELKDIRPSSAKRPVLVVLQGHPIGMALAIDKERMVIGRGSMCDIVLRDEVASRLHAEIYQLVVEGGCVEYYVKDLGSTNGTFLNGQMVSSGQLLQDGDKIKVGNHLIKFALLDEFEAEFQERLHQLTQTDELTGLRSRRSLFADLDRLITQAINRKEQKTISVIMLDLDHFKKVNDGRGHLIGSHTIRDVGHIIRDAVGSAERAARYGGEEYFAYVIGKPEQGFAIAEKIRQQVASHAFSASTSDPTQTMHITISAGVSIFPQDGISALDIVQKADQALYRAKRSGRNQTCIFDANLDKPDTAHPMVDASAIIYGPADAQ
ncbi:MAG: GGDEF domain-containing protein [Acidobacteria bacterium]|nr:GGDEF domain-containing protein [Acidobacteriota bacterium]